VVDESVPLLWGGFRVTAEVETGAEAAEGVVFALGDRFGGYALYLVAGRTHFTFARSVDRLELSSASVLEQGPHQLGVFYALGQNGAPGRMVLLVDDDALDEIPVEGMLPLALQHGGAGLRLGYDSGFPVSSRYRPPAAFSGVVHEVRIDAPGTLRPAPEDEVRVALHAD
jgi:arylsulfatase